MSRIHKHKGFGENLQEIAWDRRIKWTLVISFIVYVYALTFCICMNDDLQKLLLNLLKYDPSENETQELVRTEGISQNDRVKINIWTVGKDGNQKEFNFDETDLQGEVIINNDRFPARIHLKTIDD